MPLIRVATPAEVDSLHARWEIAAENDSHPTDNPYMVQLRIDRDPDACLVAEESGRIVGSVIAGWDGWRGSMYRLAVAASRRGAGIGRLLVAEAEKALKRVGCQRVTALVHLELGTAGPFWSKVGYAHDTEVGRFVRNL